MDGADLLDRDAVLAVLTEALSGDRDAAVLVLGERGIGRSACLAAARSRARAQGRRILETVGSERETHLPFAGLHRLVRPLLGSMQDLPAVQQRALLAALGVQDPAGADGLIVRLATLNLLRAAGDDRGLLVTVDDAHWLDAETRQALSFVARRPERHRLAVVATSSGSSASGSQDDALFGGAGHTVVLNRLDEPDAHRLVNRIAPRLTRSRRRWVVNIACGNPLALRELAATAGSVDVAGPGPFTPTPPLTEPLQRAFAGRVAELSPAARDVALVAALVPDPSLQVVLVAAGTLHGHPVGAAVVEQAQNLGVLTVDEQRLHFSHPLVRAAIVQQEPVSRRQAAHRALGGVIAQSAHRRAWHRALSTATHDDAVADELESTTHDSIRRGDVPAAISALERAAQLSEQPDERGRRLVQAAVHAARLGRATTVLRLLDVAAETRLSAFDQARAELIREDFDVVVITDSERLLHLCEMARRAAVAGRRDLCLDLLESAARRRCAGSIEPAALHRLAAVTAELVGGTEDARSTAVLALADPVRYGRSVLAAVARAEQAPPADGDELTAYGVAARSVGDYAAASRFLDRAEVPLRARGLLGPLARNLCVAADLRLDLGEWNRAAAALVGFDSLSGAAMSASHRASALATHAKIAALRGDTATALDLVSQAEHSAAVRAGSRFLARAQIVRGIACLAAGRHADAWAALSRVFDSADPCHHFREQFDAVAYLAEAAAHTGRQVEAGAVVLRLQRIADECGSPALVAHLAYAEAVLAPDDRADEAFRTALGSDAGGSSWHRARTQLAYGRWLRRRHRVIESRVPLQASLDVFRRVGATRWAAEAVDELGAAGASATADPTAPGAALLSSQELKIAHLAAQGLTNREIGDQLYLSPRTVSSHLYRTFPKLGITTRGQLAARLTRDGVVDEQPAR